jgi:hypothetical protein
MGNAHAWRHRKNRNNPCPTGCIYCKSRPNDGNYSNKNGNRHNPASKRRGKRAKK